MTSFRKVTGVLLLSSAMVVMSGCATQEKTGQVVGGVAGAAAGTQIGGGSGKTIATIGGAILGALVGGEIGGRMDEKDRQQTALALENTGTGSSTRWVNPDTGDRYEVEPTRTYQSAAGQPCRDYTMQAVIDGRNETINGTACRRADGTWE